MGCAFLDSLRIQFFGQFGEFLVRFAFFIQCFLEQVGGFIILQQLGIGARCAITRNFVVFDSLGSADQRSIQNIRRVIFLNQVLAFGEEALHPVAGFAFGFFFKNLEDLLEALDVILGLFQMFVKSLLQLG